MSQKSLLQKTAIITGASSGLGFEISKAFLKAGSNLIICSRSEKDLAIALEKLNELKDERQKIFSLPTDISNEKDVDNLINESYKRFNKIEILVNNAGIIGPKGNFEDLNWDQWKYALEINFLGSAYLVKKLIPQFKKNNFGRIIQISGGGATSPLPLQSIYAASKAAIVRFIETVSLEVKEFNITANCIAPGQLNTRIMNEYIDAGPEKIGQSFYLKVQKQFKSGGAPISKAVNLALALATEEFPILRGKLISAIWDDWENFTKYEKELNSSDVYSLRRIIAKDRNFEWGDL